MRSEFLRAVKVWIVVVTALRLHFYYRKVEAVSSRETSVITHITTGLRDPGGPSAASAYVTYFTGFLQRLVVVKLKDRFPGIVSRIIVTIIRKVTHYPTS